MVMTYVWKKYGFFLVKYFVFDVLYDDDDYGDEIFNVYFLCLHVVMVVAH